MPIIIPEMQSRRVAEALRARQSPFQGESRPGPAARDPGADTPAQDIAGLAWLAGSLEDALARRRSVRVFAPDPVSASLVNATVIAARDAEAATWPSRSHGVVTVEVLIAAYRVDGMARGMYATSFEPGTEPLRTDDFCFESLPALYADAPALLLICGDLNGACRTAGPGGYASMLVRAGTIGYAAWLSAISAGLAGSVYAPPSHRVTGAARQLDPDLRHLFTVALGVPADQAGSPGGMTDERGIS